MQKAYSPINWEDYPSEATPINEENLNRMDNALNEIDNRVLNHDSTKANTADVLTMISDVEFDEKKGIFTFTRKNGSKITLDTKLEKLAINWYYDALNQLLVITLDDGTKQEISLSALINEYEFAETDTIAFTVIDGKVKAVVKEGSINENHLRPNYLADVKLEVANAQAQAQNSATFAKNSSDNATKSESYAHGGTGTRENEDVDNAKYYYEQAKHISQGGNGLVPLGTIAFENLPEVDILTNGMYNISNDFVSDERFVDGGGVAYGKGSNVYYTATGYWDVLAASSVTGVRGSAETSFRQGNVTLSPEDLGLENVLPLLGDTDISAIGDGTVTGGLKTLFGNMLKAETLTSTTLFNITADTQPDFFVALGKAIMDRGVVLNDTIHVRGTWVSRYYFTAFCTYIPGDALEMLYFDNGSNIWIVKYNASDSTLGTYFKLAKTTDLSAYLPLSGGMAMTGALNAQHIYPGAEGTYSIGSGSKAWAQIITNAFRLYKNGVNYGYIDVMRESTTDNFGVGRIVLGNLIPEGTAGNSMGTAIFCGKNSGYTQVSPANHSTKSIEVLLPKEAGTLMLKEAFTYSDGVLTLKL